MAVSPIEISKALGGIDFPARKDDLVTHAENRGTNDDVLDAIRMLDDREYNSMADVEKSFGQERNM